jgi:hypothetical protein
LWFFLFFRFINTPSSSNPSLRITSGPRMSRIATDLESNATAMKPLAGQQAAFVTAWRERWIRHTNIGQCASNRLSPLEREDCNGFETVLVPPRQVSNLRHLLDPFTLTPVPRLGALRRKVRVVVVCL